MQLLLSAISKISSEMSRHCEEICTNKRLSDIQQAFKEASAKLSILDANSFANLMSVVKILRQLKRLVNDFETLEKQKYYFWLFKKSQSELSPDFLSATDAFNKQIKQFYNTNPFINEAYTVLSTLKDYVSEDEYCLLNTIFSDMCDKETSGSGSVQTPLYIKSLQFIRAQLILCRNSYSNNPEYIAAHNHLMPLFVPVLLVYEQHYENIELQGHSTIKATLDSILFAYKIYEQESVSDNLSTNLRIALCIHINEVTLALNKNDYNLACEVLESIQKLTKIFNTNYNGLLLTKSELENNLNLLAVIITSISTQRPNHQF